jgi:hypothetical protein
VGALLVLASLPRDVYTAAFVSNDAALELAVAICILLYLRVAVESKASVRAREVGAVLAASIVAAWTKQSGLLMSIFPLSMLALSAARQSRGGWSAVESRRLMRFSVATLVALVFLAGDEFHKASTTGYFPVSNQHFFDYAEDQEPGTLGDVAFFDFRLPSLLRNPTQSPETIASFWTQIFARLWFDYEPKLLAESTLSRCLAVVAYFLGLAVLSGWTLGVLRALKLWHARPPLYPIFIVQLAFILVPLAQTIRFPHFSSMKSMFLLPAASLGAVFLSLGWELLGRFGLLRVLVVTTAFLLALVTTLQAVAILIYIDQALAHGPLWRFPLLW